MNLTARIAERAAYAERLRGYCEAEYAAQDPSEPRPRTPSSGRLATVRQTIENLRISGRTRETERAGWKDHPRDDPHPPAAGGTR